MDISKMDVKRQILFGAVCGLIGVVAYLALRPKPAEPGPHYLTSAELSDFLPEKKLTYTCNPGGWGVLKANGDLLLALTTEEPHGPADNGKSISKWQVKGNQLYTDSGMDGGHTFTWATAFDGSKYIRDHEDANCGLEIGTTFAPSFSGDAKAEPSPQWLENGFHNTFPDYKK